MSSYLQSAFDVVCKDAKPAEGFFVTLMESVRSYGGQEEGGWWRTDERIVAYQHFPTEEQADAARAAVEELATRLEADATRENGERCLREMEWLDERGLEADWLPEPDGPATYRVIVSEGLPSEHHDPTHYE